MIFKSKNTNLNFKDAVCFLTFKKFEKFNFLKCAFSTRLCGNMKNESNFISKKDVKEKYASLIENCKFFCNIVTADSNSIVFSNQMHTDEIRIVTKEDVFFKKDDIISDAMISIEPRISLVTFFADCVPIFILDPINRAIGTIHSGWKGTVLEISKKTIEKMSKKFGSDVKNLICVIGPSIHKCCFEVNYDCVEKFKNTKIDFIENYISENENKKFQIDLQGVNRQILLNAGVKFDNIEISDLCTYCNSDLLYSYRKLGANNNGRMMGLMELVKENPSQSF